LEVLEKLDKVLCSFFLGGGSWCTDRVAGSNRLVDPRVRVNTLLLLVYPTTMPGTNHKTFVRFTQEYGFSTGAKVPGCHRKRPVSWRKLSMELQPGPPFSQIVTSSTGFPMVGW
jgi:hypothetical protein